jgi:hypothetical protein
VNINLNEDEIVFLLHLLRREMADTKSEIHHSDDHNFKDDLKKQILFIQEIINNLGTRKVNAEKVV